MKWTFIFLDNIRLHYSKEIQDSARKNNQKFYFNASYSSRLNPIERLWAFAKRIFQRDIISESEFKKH